MTALTQFDVSFAIFQTLFVASFASSFDQLAFGQLRQFVQSVAASDIEAE